jgi:hypothetical protein
MSNRNGPLRIGIGGPVVTGKTALMDALCRTFRDRYQVAAITNDIYTKEDAEFLTRARSLPPERIIGIETGGCPHTAIREDASINLAGMAEMCRRFSGTPRSADRERRRQFGSHVQSGAGRSDDLRDRRCRRRQDPAQGRSRHHPQRWGIPITPSLAVLRKRPEIDDEAVHRCGPPCAPQCLLGIGNASACCRRQRHTRAGSQLDKSFD